MADECLREADGGWILYDPELISTPGPQCFQPAYWGDRIVGSAQGRASVHFIAYENHAWVLRHYWRGGLPGKILRDQYVYLGRERSRPFREWRILRQARADGVNVPKPVAVYLRRRSGLSYSGDILMQRIENALSLADLLQESQMRSDMWQSLALTIARCHQAGYWHADMNARNLLFRDAQWWLIDFDRARQRGPGHWGFENIRRLKRSLDKLSAQGVLRYSPAEWQGFVEAWHLGLVGR